MENDEVRAWEAHTHVGVIPAERCGRNSAMRDQDGSACWASDMEQLWRESRHLRGLHWDEREDAAQQAAIKLWRRPPSDDAEKRRAYARCVLRTCGCDRRKQRLREQQFDEATELQARPRRGSVRAGLDGEGVDVEGRLAEFRRRLTRRQAKVCDAVILQDMELKPAARALGMQPCDVKSCRDAIYRRAEDFGSDYTPRQCG